jgi:hypothetical protein
MVALSSCGQSRPYSVFVIPSAASVDVRRQIADRIIARSLSLAATCKIVSESKSLTQCKFSGEDVGVRVSVSNPLNGDLEIILEEERSFYFPADRGAMFDGKYLSDLYASLEKFILREIPESVAFTAMRAFSDEKIPIRDLKGEF